MAEMSPEELFKLGSEIRNLAEEMLLSAARKLLEYAEDREKRLVALRRELIDKVIVLYISGLLLDGLAGEVFQVAKRKGATVQEEGAEPLTYDSVYSTLEKLRDTVHEFVQKVSAAEQPG